MGELSVRAASLADAPALSGIYAHYVDHTAITFEYVAPTADEFAARMAKTMERYPYLVACLDGRAVGYAYAGTFKDRAAYQWACETTIYVAPGCRRTGVGRMLYERLEAELCRMGIINLYACIAYAQLEDEYLTHDSVCFHERVGYTLCGTFRKCGYKFGRWYDMVWMEKAISAHPASPHAPLPPA